MPDAEDKEKAEKLAAAKKRFEQLKKQKGKKAPTKKKDEKSEVEVEPSATEPTDEDTVAPAADDEPATATTDDQAAEQGHASPGARPSGHGRTLSISAQSKLRSESFRKSSGPLSPSTSKPSGSPDFQNGDLKKENKRLQSELQMAEQRWQKLEEELEELREANSDAAHLKSQAKQSGDATKDLEKMRTEIASLQRQNQQLQSAASRRRSSAASPSNNSNEDLLAQLSSKTSTIESMELEISKLHVQLTNEKSAAATHASKIASLESELEKEKYSLGSTARELADLKANLDKASERAVAEGSSRSSAETRVAQLEAELGTANRNSEEASKRTSTLEKKVEALTTLHRESDARSQTKISEMQRTEREAKELRTRVTALSNENGRLRDEAIRRKKMEASGDAAGLEELEDEERLRMQNRVRELEEEVFELRRGLWRDKRREMQAGMEDSPGFDEVDLSGTSSPWRTNASPYGNQQQHSTFTDVLQSGINAFTGQTPRRRQSSGAAKGRPRKQSLGLLSEDDFEFDEDAFRKAQEEEGKARLERVREIKRGLKKWEGWRADFVDSRTRMGGVFEV